MRLLPHARTGTTRCNHADAHPTTRNGVPRILLMALEGRQILAYLLSPVRRFRVTENSQSVQRQILSQH